MEVFINNEEVTYTQGIPECNTGLKGYTIWYDVTNNKQEASSTLLVVYNNYPETPPKFMTLKIKKIHRDYENLIEKTGTLSYIFKPKRHIRTSYPRNFYQVTIKLPAKYKIVDPPYKEAIEYFYDNELRWNFNETGIEELKKYKHHIIVNYKLPWDEFLLDKLHSNKLEILKNILALLGILAVFKWGLVCYKKAR